MKFRDLGAQYTVLKKEIDKGIAGVISSSSFILGPQVNELESKLAEFVGMKHCITCASGTDALIMPLMVWGIGPNDAVFAPDFTYIASVSSALRCNAKVVLVDVDKDTFNMDPVALEKAIQKTIAEGKYTPKVIIPVDLFGLCADYKAIRKIADKYGLKILEDGAQGFGGMIGDRRACSFGDVGSTSFFPAKPLGCYGDGGAIFTNDDAMDEKLRSIRANGRDKDDKYNNITVGLNSRLDTLQAAILLAKFDAFKKIEIDASNKVAAKYTELLKDYVKTPVIPEGYLSSWAQYTICLKDEKERNGLKDYLKEKGIPSMIYYPRGMHQQTAVKNTGCSEGAFQVTENLVKKCLSLPIHPYMEEEHVEFVINNILAFLK